MKPADLEAFLAGIERSLPLNHSREDIVAATAEALDALTVEERESISVEELRRRLAVGRSVDFTAG